MADMEKSRQHPFRLSLREHRAMFGVEPDILDQIALYLAEKFGSDDISLGNGLLEGIRLALCEPEYAAALAHRLMASLAGFDTCWPVWKKLACEVVEAFPIE